MSLILKWAELHYSLRENIPFLVKKITSPLISPVYLAMEYHLLQLCCNVILNSLREDTNPQLSYSVIDEDERIDL